MNKKRWLLLIVAFFVIDGLIVVSNRIFYQQIQDIEDAARADHAAFETKIPETAPKRKKPSPVFIDPRNDPLAPMVKPRAKSESKETPPRGTHPRKVYETGTQSQPRILVQ